jgi:hypothetical protein
MELRFPIFLFSTASRLALHPTQWTPEALSSGIKLSVVKTNNLSVCVHLVPKLKTYEAVCPLSDALLFCGA